MTHPDSLYRRGRGEKYIAEQVARGEHITEPKRPDSDLQKKKDRRKNMVAIPPRDPWSSS